MKRDKIRNFLQNEKFFFFINYLKKIDIKLKIKKETT